MRDYGKVAPQFWTGATGRALRGSPDAQLLALYLMTCPASSMTGIFYLPLTTISHETGLPAGRVRTALKRLNADGAVQYDEDAALAYVTNMARFQIGETLHAKDKRVPGIIRELSPFKGHRFVSMFWRAFEGAYCLGPCPWKPLGSPFEGPSKPLRSQEQEQEQEQDQEQEQEHEQEAADGGAVVAVPVKPAIQVFDHYRTHHKRAHPRPKDDSKEWKLIEARFAEGYTAEDICAAIDGYHLSPWHCGENDRRTKYLDLELFVRDGSHVAKGIEFAQQRAGPVLSEREQKNVRASVAWLERHGGPSAER